MYCSAPRSRTVVTPASAGIATFASEKNTSIAEIASSAARLVRAEESEFRQCKSSCACCQIRSAGNPGISTDSNCFAYAGMPSLGALTSEYVTPPQYNGIRPSFPLHPELPRHGLMTLTQLAFRPSARRFQPHRSTENRRPQESS